MRDKQGFTLIELLVVIVVLGILAAIVLPQYRLVVKRAELTTYIDAVRALRDAENMYFLQHGRYTDDLRALDIGFFHGGDCTYYEDSYCSVYECGDKWYGVCNNASNAQAGTKEFTNYKLRYLHVFKDFSNNGAQLHAGDIVCMARKEIEKKACKSIGQTEIVSGDENSTETWYRYIK